MCLTTSSRRFRTATRSRRVWKVVRVGRKLIRSYNHKYFVWTIGIPRKLSDRMYIDHRGEINAGFHSYTRLMYAKYRLDIAYSFKDRKTGLAIAEMVIPRGAKYALSIFGDEIVSDKITMKSILK